MQVVVAIFVGVVALFTYAHGECTEGGIQVSNDTFTFVPIPANKCYSAAWGTFAACGVCANNVNVTGWATLDIITDDSFTDEEQAYAAGYFEGYTTQNLIWMMFQNIYESFWGPDNSSYIPIKDWLAEQYAWEQSMVQNDTDYWAHVNLTRLQVQGMFDGYHDAAPSDQMLTDGDLLILASIGDVAMSLLYYIDHNHYKFNKPLIELLASDHCTAIIKVTADDFFVGETMWEDYTMMLRIFKHYSFKFNNGLTVNYNSAFSGYPGVLMSLDDFYRLDDVEMIVMETAISVVNKTMLEYLSNQGLLAWQRLLISNRIASDPTEWATNMATHSTGTFPVTWMALDISYAPDNGTLQPNTLWITEETPGETFFGDATAVLQEQMYWASYNMPFWVGAWDRLGFPPMVPIYNMTYQHNPRANIIRQRSSAVVDIPSMQYLIRYNDWQHDTEQRGSPGWGVTSRNDLPVYNCSLCNPSCFGGLDAKVTSRSDPAIYAISGPSYQMQTPFMWSESSVCVGMPHMGQPDLWVFEWEEMPYFFDVDLNAKHITN